MTQSSNSDLLYQLTCQHLNKCKSFRSTSLPKGSTDDTRKSSGYERGDGKHTEIENARLLTVKHANTENVVPKSHCCLWGKYIEFMIITYNRFYQGAHSPRSLVFFYRFKTLTTVFFKARFEFMQWAMHLPSSRTPLFWWHICFTLMLK